MKIRTKLCQIITILGAAGILFYLLGLDAWGFLTCLLDAFLFFMAAVLNLSGLLDETEIANG